MSPAKKLMHSKKSKLTTIFPSNSSEKLSMSLPKRAINLNNKSIRRLAFEEMYKTGQSPSFPGLELNKKSLVNSLKMPENMQEIVWKNFVWYNISPAAKKTNLSVQQKQQIFSIASNNFWKIIAESKKAKKELNAQATKPFARIKFSLQGKFPQFHESVFPSNSFFKSLFYEMLGKPLVNSRKNKTAKKTVLPEKTGISTSVIFSWAKKGMNANQIAKKLGEKNLAKLVYQSGRKTVKGFTAVNAMIDDAKKFK